MAGVRRSAGLGRIRRRERLEPRYVPLCPALLKFGTEYAARSLVEYEAQVREKLERSLRRK